MTKNVLNGTHFVKKKGLWPYKKENLILLGNSSLPKYPGKEWNQSYFVIRKSWGIKSATVARASPMLVSAAP